LTTDIKPQLQTSPKLNKTVTL